MMMYYEPKLEILIYEDDLKDILVDKFGGIYDIYSIFGPPTEWGGIFPSKMFGEVMIITDEACPGEPLVLKR